LSDCYIGLIMNSIIKVIRKLRITLLSIYTRAYLRAVGVELGRNVKLGCPPTVFRNKSARIVLADGVCLAGGTLQNKVCTAGMVIAADAPGACVFIGAFSGISCSVIYAVDKITIGKNVNIGAGCRIYDTDFHPVSMESRRIHDVSKIKTAAVVIEDDVWLAANVTVLKGVTIGKGSVIATGSVVVNNIPAGVIAGGVPAKVLKYL